MEWSDSSLFEPVVQQAAMVAEAAQPTNPSTLTLALIAFGTYLALGLGRRQLARTGPAHKPSSSTPSSKEQRHAA
ncbi:MAG: hypothetical protein MI725_06630 [Pirellulales bacterium]|nr:hypothetical protein [Pirellulales bacterium]